MVGIKRRFWIAGILIIGLCLCSCSQYTEPEQVYLVSAMGFDGVEDEIRVTVEIPVIGESGSSQQKTMRFTQTGEDVRRALRRMESGLSRELIFSHCALAALGETLSKEQMQEIFAFAGTGEGIPLAAEAVVCGDAEKLLGVDGFSGIAMGYEIHQILERERQRMGAKMPCGIYELRGMATPDAPIALPRFEVVEEKEGESVRLAGMDVLRPDGAPFRMTLDECVPYAILTDTFGESMENGIRWSRVRTDLALLENDGIPQLTLRLNMEATGRGQSDPQAVADLLCQRTEALFQRVREETGEDLFRMASRIGEASLDGAVLTVVCDVKVRG